MDVLNSARIIDVGYVPDDCHYWFVRTQGGRLFKEFCKESYIAVGWNDINIDTIKDFTPYKSLYNVIEKYYPHEQRKGLTTSHLNNFVNKMQINDIVIIPSRGSQLLAFGIITSDAYEDTNTSNCEFLKRRKVNWIKTYSIKELDPALSIIKYKEATISCVDKLSNLIDRHLAGFLYKKGDLTTLVFDAGIDGDIPYINVSNFMNSLIKLVNDYYPDVPADEIYLKINMQSRGKFQISCKVAGVIFLIATALWNCGFKNESSITFKTDIGTIEHKSKGPTFIDEIIKYQDAAQEREMRRKHEQIKIDEEQFMLDQKKLKASLPPGEPEQGELPFENE